MGLFDIWTIPHRVAAGKIQDHTLSLEVTPLEESLAKLIDVQTYRYVAERTYLLPALARQILYFRAQQLNREEVNGALNNLERRYGEYFATRPGVDKNVSLYHWHMAQHDYVLDDVASLGGRFLTRLTDGRLKPPDAPDVPRFMELVESLVRDTATIVESSTARLK